MKEFVSGEKFHTEINNVYSGALDWAVNKEHSKMAKVLYIAPHENKDFNDIRRGKGKDFATWVFSEEKGIKENIFSTGFELMIDAKLEPDACIGLHFHNETEEIYYILEGSIKMTTVSPENKESTKELFAGDAHAVKLGQGHYGIAGKEGVRFIAVAMRKSKI